MIIPALRGVVRRRILVNFRVDPTILERQLPAPFQPKLLDGWAVAGICLIRLEQIRPKGIPAALGRSSENAAHRIAVTWTGDNGTTHDGVYIPRRDTGSRLNHLIGGRFFPGEHYLSSLSVQERDGWLDLRLVSDDGTADLSLRAHVSRDLPSTSRFASLADATAFFAAGADGYSATRRAAHLDGLRMQAEAWPMRALAVDSLSSAFFANQHVFPADSIQFDSALIMRDVEHEWQPLPDFRLSPGHTVVNSRVG